MLNVTDIIEQPAFARGLSGGEAAGRVRQVFPGLRPSEIAELLGLRIESGRWFPVTAGEFEKSKAVITVNHDADVDAEDVVAHELGHFVLDRLGLVQDEVFCDEFAKELRVNVHS